jgi:drug/metabolite transporter (DMT)-like permease
VSDPALPRFVALQVARLIGALIALLGVVVLSHGQPALARVPDALGDGLIVAGAVAFFAVPIALGRRWKAGQ